MAGSFGYEQGHCEVSKACGERVLFPAVRDSADQDLIVAPGFSCRHQIADFCDNRRSLHTASCWRWRGERGSGSETLAELRDERDGSDYRQSTPVRRPPVHPGDAHPCHGRARPAGGGIDA